MKLGLRREEQRQVSQEKLKAIFKARGKEQQEVTISLDIVLSKVFRKNKITDQSRSDGRCKEANEFHQDSGALSNRNNSPAQVKSENQSFIEEKSEAYHLAQVKLFVSGYLSLLRSSCYARCISRLLIG